MDSRTTGDDTGLDPPPPRDALLALRQRAYPKQFLSWLSLVLTRARLRPWKNWQIRWFCRRYGVDVGEAANADPLAYPDFNTFFTRELRPGCRPIEGGESGLVSPVDGTVSQAGTIANGRLLQAKGIRYSSEALLAGDADAARAFQGGIFATLYLAPRDYHRVHMPLAGRLVSMTHVPGMLFSVNPRTVDVVDGIFARNERVISRFETALGEMAVILVGAVLVGGIEQVWHGAVTPPRRARTTTWRYDGDAAIDLPRGAEMGRFNMGSTVIVLLANPDAAWAPRVVAGATVRMGQRLGGVA